MRYEYTDTFLTKDIEITLLEKIEDAAIEEVNRLNIFDEFYFEKLVTSKVYMELCKEQFEDEGVRKKYEIYKNEFERYYTLSQKSGINTIKISRG